MIRYIVIDHPVVLGSRPVFYTVNTANTVGRARLPSLSPVGVLSLELGVTHDATT